MKRGLAALLISSIFAICPRLQTPVNAQDVQGWIHSSVTSVESCCVDINKLGSPKKFGTVTNKYGFYSCPIDSAGQINDTLRIMAWKNIDETHFVGKTAHIIKDSCNYTLEFYVELDENWSQNFTPNIEYIRDTSGVTGPILGVCWLKKDPKRRYTSLVDTSHSNTHHSNWFVNISSANIDSGDSAYIQLNKKIAGFILRTSIGFTADPCYFNAKRIRSNGDTGKDTIVFPLEGIVDTIGVEENKATAKRTALSNPILGLLKVNAKRIEVYSLDGRCLKSMNVNDNVADLRQFPPGVYFIKDEEKTYKIINLE